jgi:ferric-dicitrate binding protein FerR (iron transport regulator)
MEPHRAPSEGPTLLSRLSEFVRTMTSGEVTVEAGLVARERFLSDFARHRRRRPVNTIAWSSAGLLAAGAAAAHLVQPARLAPDGPHARAGNGYIAGGGDANARAALLFPSGPSVELSPEGRGRVRDADPGRARVVLEGGRAKVRGGEHHDHDVLIVAGPYAVTSRGAEFDVSWSGDEIEVRVDSGSVTVAGPVVSEGLTLFEGQTFAASEAAWELRCF